MNRIPKMTSVRLGFICGLGAASLLGCFQSDVPQSTGRTVLLDGRESVRLCATNKNLLEMSRLDMDILHRLIQTDPALCVKYAAGRETVGTWSRLSVELQTRANVLGTEILSSCSTTTGVTNSTGEFEPAYLGALEQLSVRQPAQFERFLSNKPENDDHSEAECAASIAFMETFYGLPPEALLDAMRSPDFYDEDFELSAEGERRFNEIIETFALANPEPLE